MQQFHSNGKLLLTGEYLVLDGALALALPAKKGQSLTITKELKKEGELKWLSYDNKGELWFEAHFTLARFDVTYTNAIVVSDRLQKILREVKKLNPNFLDEEYVYTAENKMEFPTNWGLGSSSTLINNLAQWAEVDAYTLLQKTFGGSGYDVACAKAQKPLFYRLNEGKPEVLEIDFKPKFSENLYFIYLGEKQDSQLEVKKYKAESKISYTDIDKISTLTREISRAEDISTFENLLEQHENILSKILQRKTIKAELFSDYPGAIKSLGAWGGDFILVSTYDKNQLSYFSNKGYTTIIPYQEMVY